MDDKLICNLEYGKQNYHFCASKLMWKLMGTTSLNKTINIKKNGPKVFMLSKARTPMSPPSLTVTDLKYIFFYDLICQNYLLKFCNFTQSGKDNFQINLSK